MNDIIIIMKYPFYCIGKNDMQCRVQYHFGGVIIMISYEKCNSNFIKCTLYLFLIKKIRQTHCKSKLGNVLHPLHQYTTIRL